ncbi:MULTISPECIES: MarR family transcriptional regulator [unclassified Pseudonocardia]|jgi:DNA-binding MarR family transcriptional regulator|uniref:MarR family winged helix-turn-helix transcriptional regulator n=1 Tax=unclassified Pseudonocardia TaxID=2619320 RepID=UPI000AF3F37B|nr:MULTISPECIES: MarR family transcriptional regulator [unclassified Pseudonocardia]MBN9100637.1 MarR family transcriptional regulator [Pseudonocardia sp.]
MPDTFDADDVARLRIALARVSRQLDRHSRGGSLSTTQASVLASTAKHGPVRISDLAEFEGINPTMLSRIVAKLEDAGLLRRRPDPDDGRAALVETTEAGLAQHRTLREERTRLLTDRLAAMPADRAAQLLAALPALEALAQIPSGPLSSENS